MCVETGSASLVTGYIPVALSKSEGAGSVLALAWLPGAHLYIQVLGNKKPNGYCGPVTHTLSFLVLDARFSGDATDRVCALRAQGSKALAVVFQQKGTGKKLQ